MSRKFVCVMCECVHGGAQKRLLAMSSQEGLRRQSSEVCVYFFFRKKQIKKSYVFRRMHCLLDETIVLLCLQKENQIE